MGNLLSKLKKEKINNSIDNQNNFNNLRDDKDNSNNLRDYKNNEIYLSPRKLWRPPTPPKKYSNKGLNNIK